MDISENVIRQTSIYKPKSIVRLNLFELFKSIRHDNDLLKCKLFNFICLGMQNIALNQPLNRRVLHKNVLKH